MQSTSIYKITRSLTEAKPNLWDILVIILVLGVLSGIAWGALQMTTPYQLGDKIKISLEISALPGYAVSTVLRMFIAIFFSLIFTFTVAPLAAKNKHAEKLIIPFIDIMQSVPILAILALVIVIAIKIFPNSLLGPEIAAIFVIFTSQVWNMTLSLYQSLKNIPHDLQEAAKMYRLSAWQRFWKLEVPYGTPGLLWNTMMSMSGGWFYIVYSEAITVANQEITLPGVGSYISTALVNSDLNAIFYSICTMCIVILIYDQFMFRPLLSWCAKFKSEIDEEELLYESWFFDALAKTKLLKKLENLFAILSDLFINIPSDLFTLKTSKKPNNQPFCQIYSFSKKNKAIISKFGLLLWNIILTISIATAIFWILKVIQDAITMTEILHVLYLGAITACKVFILIIIASVVWVPIGVWIGLSPRASIIVQPLIQFLAAFPANLLYPLVVIAILKYDLNRHIWTTPLMILGTQWYILFNVIGGTTTIPKEIKLAAKNFGVTGWLWWKRLSLPAIFPYYVTGAMAAAGGCWNASIAAEFVTWGNNSIISIGLGSYIEKVTSTGDFPRIVLGTTVMSFYVLLFNRFVWQKLYQIAESKCSIN